MLIDLILKSGKSAIDLCLYVLLPVMVVMMSFMHLMEEKRVLSFISRFFYPILKLFGLPGLGIFAALQILLVSFAAPIATLTIMEKEKISEREIASSLAMIFTMSQANAVFPLIVYGLNFKIIFITSIIGGILASSITFYIFGKHLSYDNIPHREVLEKRSDKSVLSILLEGGNEAVNLIIRSIPLILLAIFVVNVLKSINFILFLEDIFKPFITIFGVNPSVTLPIVTKFLAGGTAMMAVTIDLIKSGIMTAKDLNLIAGFIINPFDIVGVMVLCSAGDTTKKVLKQAALGATVGIIFKGVLHYLLCSLI
ncbi:MULTISPECIES: nucleoside recognition domain-containing protein [Calditerrivibrio]|uniref:Nucleoside recognition family protein n=1 Tax=Calditerrivibrio nitroreducens TaxID=477976 RepID=A0A2J6WGD7_9BACT|nr:MAG: nucleoside recognition family protein [Calditerrivibrio nitroreducens]